MNAELRDTLLAAYRCRAFDGVCKSMRYDANRGLFPRGYAGGTGTLAEITLVLCIAEPGEPPPSAKPQPTAEPRQQVELIATSVGKALRESSSAFHKNVRYLLDRCWPGMPFEDQMRRTWITEGVLCSAEVTTGPIIKAVETECADRYLSKQLQLLRGAFVIALGRKAERRVKLARRTPDAIVIAAGLPGGNSKKAKPSWDAAGLAFRKHLECRECVR